MGRKLKEKQRKFLRNKKAFILITVLCMGVGFAFLTSNLTITGNTSVSGNSWNVYFTNVQVTDGSVDATVVPTTSGTNTTFIDYTVTLDKPGDFYEFTVDAVNNGTIDAMVQNVNMTSLDTDVEKYLNYTAFYENGASIAQNNLLKKNSKVTYKVRVEFKKNIEASDLDEEGINLTLTFGVNYTQSNIKSMEFLELVKNDALNDNSINFAKVSSETNGKGLYVRTGTENDNNPIYYYRGAVENNNALFAGFCWKIVRTTETGGTKLIYNGVPSNIYNNFEKINNSSYINVENSQTYPFSFDTENKNWINTTSTQGEESEITFSIQEEGNYNLNYDVTMNNSWVYVSIYKDEEEIARISESEGKAKDSIELYNITPSTVIKVKFTKYIEIDWENPEAELPPNDDGIKFHIDKGVGESVVGCANKGEASQIKTSKFNVNSSSPAYHGYMYGTVYVREGKSKVKNQVFGNSFIYENGTYTLSNTSTREDTTHHYTCFNSTGTCSSLSYVFYGSSYLYYITLTNGKSIEDAISEMQTNRNNSTIKTEVDNWFNNTFKTFFTNKSKNYNNYLEDTVWCNDRSWNTIDVEGKQEYINSGWLANGGNLDNYLFYSSYGRMRTGTPNLTCSNKNDSFTVEESTNGNGKLTYPVGLLTADEIMLAGGKLYIKPNSDQDFYLNTKRFWWSMSPSYFSNGSSILIGVNSEGREYDISTYDTNGVRPSISIKSDVKVGIDGDGTAENPYEFLVD